MTRAMTLGSIHFSAVSPPARAVPGSRASTLFALSSPSARVSVPRNQSAEPRPSEDSFRTRSTKCSSVVPICSWETPSMPAIASPSAWTSSGSMCRSTPAASSSPSAMSRMAAWREPGSAGTEAPAPFGSSSAIRIPPPSP